MPLPFLSGKIVHLSKFPIILKLGFCSVAVFYSTPVDRETSTASLFSIMSNIIVVVVVGGGGVPFFLRLYLCLWRSIYRFLPQQCDFLLFAHYNHYKPSKVIVEALCVDKSCSGGERKCRWMRKNLRSWRGLANPCQRETTSIVWKCWLGASFALETA
jgi:hypothetical protein